MHARAYTHEHQVHLLTAIAAKMVEERFKLIIVDSIMACFRWVRYQCLLFCGCRRLNRHKCSSGFASSLAIDPADTGGGGGREHLP